MEEDRKEELIKFLKMGLEMNDPPIREMLKLRTSVTEEQRKEVDDVIAEHICKLTDGEGFGDSRFADAHKLFYSPPANAEVEVCVEMPQGTPDERGEQPVSTLNVDQQSRACSCGARHTSQPNWHMNYCPMKEY